MNISFPVPITYQIHRLRDGKSFASRKVDGIQKGNVIFTLMASFQVIYILLDLEKFKFLVIILFSVVVNLALLCPPSLSLSLYLSIYLSIYLMECSL